MILKNTSTLRQHTSTNVNLNLKILSHVNTMSTKRGFCQQKNDFHFL